MGGWRHRLRGGDVMKIWDAELCGRKQGAKIVTDGLLLWIDAADGLFNQDGSPIANGTTKQVYYDDVYFKNRADNTLVKLDDAGVLSLSYRTANVVCEDDTFKLSLSSVPSANATAFRVQLNNDYMGQMLGTVLSSEVLIKQAYDVRYSNFNCGNILCDSSYVNVKYPENQDVGNYKLSVGIAAYLQSGYPLLMAANAYENGVKKSIYKNGVLYAQNSYDQYTAQSFTPIMSIGGSWAYARYIYISSIRLYSRALTADEFLQNYNADKALGRVL